MPTQSANPILSLAQRALREQLSSQELTEQVNALLARGVYGYALNEAIQATVEPAAPTPFIEKVGAIVTLITQRAGDRENAGKMQLTVAHVLGGRYDRLSLSIAAEAYLAARQLLGGGHRSYRDALLKESAARGQLASLGVDAPVNLNSALALCAEARPQFDDGSAGYGRVLLNEASVRQGMADLGVEPLANLAHSISLCEAARQCFEEHSPLVGRSLATEADARQALARLGGEPAMNLLRAVSLCEEARNCIEEGSSLCGSVLIKQGNALHALAHLGYEPAANLHRAANLYESAQRCFEEGGTQYGRALMNGASAYCELAGIGEEPAANLSRSATVYGEARGCFEADSLDYGRALMNEGSALHRLARLGKEPVTNLYRAVSLAEAAGRCFGQSLAECGIALVNEGVARESLADLGQNPEANLRAAVRLYQEARRSLVAATPYYGIALTYEGNAWHALSETDDESAACLHRAMRLYEEARPCFMEGSPDYGSVLSSEGLVRQALARLHIEPVENLERAAWLHQQSRRCLAPGDPHEGAALSNEANARNALAELGREPVANLQLAVMLQQEASERVATGSPHWGVVRRNLAHALRNLARLQPDGGWLLRGYERLREGLGVLEGARSQLRREQERIAFLEIVTGQYAAIVTVALDLEAAARTAGDHEAAERWRREAWHWVHHAKSRALLELLSEARPRLSGADETLWRALEQAEDALDDRDEELRLLEALFGAGDSSGRARAMPPGGALGFPEDEWERAREAREEARQAYLGQREQVLAKVEGAKELRALDVPDPRQVVADLRQLAQRGARRASTDAPRPLLVEFFTLNDDEFVVFLLPLWDAASPTPVAVRFAMPVGEVADMVRAFHQATLDLASAGRDPGGCSSGSASEPSGGNMAANTAIRQPARRTSLASRPPSEWSAGGVSAAAPSVRVGRAAMDTGSERSAASDAIDGVLTEMGRLVEPWAEHLREWRPTHLIFSPHVLLNLLPLHAACWGRRPLIEQFAISYLPSASLAGRLACRQRTPGDEALLLGNPTGDLEGADAEVTSVDAALRQAGFACHTFRGDAATRDSIWDHGPGATIVHAACHSVLDEEDFLRSGIELADRRLTVLELIARLELRHAVLVYLSSCDSGRPLLGRTDELMALARAFFFAGSPTVIATLWPVDDAAAGTFACVFYHCWLVVGDPMAEAFRAAMLSTRAEHPEPYCWAPFVLLGAWETAPRCRTTP